MSNPLGGGGRRIGGDLSVRESPPGGGGAPPENVLADSSSAVSAPLFSKAKTIIIFLKKNTHQTKTKCRSLQSVELHIHENAAPPLPLQKSRAMAQKKRTLTGFPVLYGRSRAIEK